MGFEVNASIAGLVMMQPNTRNNGFTHNTANARPVIAKSGMPNIENTFLNVIKKNERNLRFNNVAENATPIAERLIQSLLNRTNDGATSGIRQTRSVLQRNADYTARFVGLSPLGKSVKLVV
jgi:hypothetical protein